MKRIALIPILIATSLFLLNAQTKIISTNGIAEQILLGNYDPQDYAPASMVDQPQDIVKHLINNISPDSMKSYLFKLASYKNRNTGSDTISEIIGIGAARKWVYDQFLSISNKNDGRLIPSYLQFDMAICNMNRHKNIFAVLPGLDTLNHEVVLIEAHMDSRCAGLCDVNCLAQGMEDNGSGTALVIELARVMSALAFDRTIVFVATIGEEQGLFGASAFAQYIKAKKISLVAVLNNDVIGGIICGKTSSPPSCPGFNSIDSTQVRLFSQGGFNSKNKQLSRFIKLQYMEEANHLMKVPMKVTIMSAEDRTGRGGDHIPFREHGYAAMRFTSANEHGNADVSNASYMDRQHTSADILGVDLNNDASLDSFFVDFNYLSRNTIINGVAAAMAGIGPITPDLVVTKTDVLTIVDINDAHNYGNYRVFVRSATNDFDSLFTTNETHFTFTKPVSAHYVSVASVDQNGVESLFSKEVVPTLVSSTDIDHKEQTESIELLQNRPNPFDEATIISFVVHEKIKFKHAFLFVRDLSGKEVWREQLELKEGMNEILYEHGYNMTGTFVYSIVIDNKEVASKQMIFAN